MISDKENLAEHILNNPPYYSEKHREWARKELEKTGHKIHEDWLK
jgi:tRNA1(Val) A37 N6-methylase TrmN6